MTHQYFLTGLTFALWALSPFTAYANSLEENGRFFSFSIGYYNAFDDEKALDLRVEYRPNTSILTPNLKPWAGLELTHDFSAWAGGGLLYDYEFAPRWHFTPSIGAGLYARGSSDLDLDHPIQFRTQIELAHELDSGQRLGLAVSHMSNAGLGNGDNPGAETISLYWHVAY